MSAIKWMVFLLIGFFSIKVQSNINNTDSKDNLNELNIVNTTIPVNMVNINNTVETPKSTDALINLADTTAIPVNMQSINNSELTTVKPTASDLKENKTELALENNNETTIDIKILKIQPKYNKIRVFSQLNVKCPEFCICESNMFDNVVATCNRLDADKQKFDSSITDLQVVNVSPLYPIVLSDDFFKKIGLESIESIKITNCTIEEITENAFKGLNNVYSINLKNNGIETIHPDTFSTNSKLRILNLADNDLSNMQKRCSPNFKYMLKAGIEELDLTNCHLTKLQSTAFDELKNIVYIKLSNNKLRTLPSEIFKRVELIEELNLSNNLITILPKMIFNKTSLSILNLLYNNLSSSQEFFSPYAQRLDLSYCKFTIINNEMFKGLDKLIYLSLRGNQITNIHPNSFSTLKKLSHLDLSSNNIEQLSSIIFLNNSKLEMIKLNNNLRLKKLPSEGFESATGQFEINSFDLSNCDIKHLSDNIFSTMPKLSFLKLSGNKIQYFCKGTFNSLKFLFDIDLRNNLIEEFSHLLFLHNVNLYRIKLSGNPIKSLSSRTFLPTINLKELDVSGCELNNFWTESSKTPEKINILKSLNVLNISNNNITAIYKSDLDIMPSLNCLDISNNPLNCDTRFHNLIKWLSSKRMKTSYPCATNLETSNSKWDELAKKICSPVSQKTLLLSDSDDN